MPEFELALLKFRELPRMIELCLSVDENLSDFGLNFCQGNQVACILIDEIEDLACGEALIEEPDKLFNRAEFIIEPFISSHAKSVHETVVLVLTSNDLLVVFVLVVIEKLLLPELLFELIQELVEA